MAANKFATMLNRNTNKITLVLIYAILEWVLIILLLLNSLFSYLIIKFADYFGLKTPCIWCTRIDHLIERKNKRVPCRDLVCESHATEISRLGFCSNHKKLAESQDMCEDCSSSSSQLSRQSFGFFPWMKQIEKVEEESLSCSCCGAELDSRFYSPCILIKPSMEVLGFGQKQNLMAEGGVDLEADEGDRSDHSGSDFVLDHDEDKQSNEENRGIDMVFEVHRGSGRREEDAGESCGCSVCDGVKDDEVLKLDFGVEKGKEAIEEDESLNVPQVKDDDEPCEQNTAPVDCNGEKTREITAKHLDFFIHGDDCRLIPVELVGSTAKEDGNQSEDFILDFDMGAADAEAAPVIENWHFSGETVTQLSCQEDTKANGVETESIQLRTKGQSSGLQVEEENLEQNYEDFLAKDDNVESNMDRRDVELCSDVSVASEDASQMQGEEFEADVSIGTEIPDQEQVDEYQSQDILLDTNQRIQEDDNGHDREEEEFLEFRTVSSLEVRMSTVNNHLSQCLELHENEEEKVPDTPTSVESLHQIHKKLLLLDRKESGTAEESLDGGSVMSDIECGGEVTVEKLKSALKSERKALSTLYAELEEERSASAVAASQTMAMINRIQEEKAAMQMEALQYQRMMEEQSEYDQEALQILNELMLKREKEKQEVEKELEVYRKKVHEYEVREREKMMLSRREGSSSMKSRNSSPSCSVAEDSDGVSIDLNHEECSSNQNTPVDAVLYVEESLTNFEQERLSILEQLKVLEEKLVVLNCEEEQQEVDDGDDNDVKSVEHLFEENGNGYHVNGFSNGHAKEANGKHHHNGTKIVDIKAKRLLPLFDAIGAEAEDVELSGDEDDELEFSAENINSDKKRVDLEVEVDHVYERLQVLEADREFLKHCISSLKKGDKGLLLLQEILQHLRDLRNVELRGRNIGDLAL